MAKITCPLNQSARNHGSKPAVQWGVRRITYAQLDGFVNTTVKALKERNLKAGSRVALVTENSVETIIVLLSLWRLGATACIINSRFPNSKIATLLKKVKATAVVIDQPGALAGIQIGISKTLITDLIVFDVKESFLKADTASLQMDANQEAAVIFTSATTGEAKAAVLTYGNLYYNALGSGDVIKLAPGDRWLLSLPLFHVAGLGVVMRCILAGATIVIVKQENLPRLITDGKTTHASLVPTQLFRLFNDKHLTGAHGLKAILLGGSAIPQSLIEESLKRKLPVYVSYGLTEMGSQVATGLVRKAGQPCAKVLAHRELKIMDGEIAVRGATLFKGYLDGDLLVLPLHEGWFLTGDLGSLDDDGHLQVFGRRDNMFISGGENIHPEEIEAVLLKVDGIAQAVVVPKEDKEFGHRPAAFIQWNKEAHIKTGDALTKFLAGELPKFKIPAVFYPWPEAIKDGIKPDRKTLSVLAQTQR